jgi:hypothetical protein
MESPKVGNLPPEFPVHVRVSGWMVLAQPQPKRLPHGLIEVYTEGFDGKSVF